MLPDILVIDDDPAILMTVADILIDEGYTVRTATNGLDGLAAVEQQLPMLILLDMRMPGLDGWGVARALRERGVVVPVVVMTAAHDARRWGDEIGTSYVLAKPFELIELLTTVEQLVAS